MKVNNIDRSIVNEGEPVLYYLKDGSKHRFIREELQIVPPGTKLPPEDSLCHFDFHNSTSENKKKQNMQQNSPYKTTNYNMSQPELHVQKKKWLAIQAVCVYFDQRHMNTFDHYLQW